MQPLTRVQGNIVNRVERRFLDWACGVMPEGITSDHLTVFGVFGAFVVLAGYAAGRTNPHYLWIAAFGYVIHWFGDSLDGSLARFRGVTRPRYGYFLDHSLDAFCIFLMIGGMGLCSYVRLDVTLLVVISYLLLCIHVFLKGHVTGTFQLSFLAAGPTELRIGFVALTLWMFFQGYSVYHVGNELVSSYDIILIGLSAVLLVLFVVNTLSLIFKLRAIEGDGRRAPVAVPRALTSRFAAEPAEQRSPVVKDAAAY